MCDEALSTAAAAAMFGTLLELATAPGIAVAGSAVYVEASPGGNDDDEASPGSMMADEPKSVVGATRAAACSSAVMGSVPSSHRQP